MRYAALRRGYAQRDAASRKKVSQSTPTRPRARTPASNDHECFSTIDITTEEPHWLHQFVVPLCAFISFRTQREHEARADSGEQRSKHSSTTTARGASTPVHQTRVSQHACRQKNTSASSSSSSESSGSLSPIRGRPRCSKQGTTREQLQALANSADGHGWLASRRGASRPRGVRRGDGPHLGKWRR